MEDVGLRSDGTPEGARAALMGRQCSRASTEPEKVEWS